MFKALRAEIDSTRQLVAMRQSLSGRNAKLADMAIKAVTFDRLAYLLDHGYDDPNWSIVQGVLSDDQR